MLREFGSKNGDDLACGFRHAELMSPVMERFDRDAQRWSAVLKRDVRADGFFYYAVRTTGVYCRPGCGARRPRRENVTFYPDRAAAEAAGYRPCRRCRPDSTSPTLRRVARACRSIEAAAELGQVPRLSELAREAKLSPFHFQRLFKKTVGVTPRAYAAAARIRRLHERLPSQRSVSEAIYAAGFGSASNAYRRGAVTLGMTPRRFSRGAPGESIRFAFGGCSLGTILVAATTQGVCALLLGDDEALLQQELQQRFSRAQLVPADAAFGSWVAQAVALVDAPQTAPALPLDIRGTAFQRRVWQALQDIPGGSTASYAEVAARIGAPSAARAVAQACAANPLAVAIPCHRVVRGDGGLSGYRWGVERKRSLLEREGAAIGDAVPGGEAHGSAWDG
jgi:AraC family transcriptional regulator of adaptative response/methylated-DNA-[protein]-cysteine methyltransferase